MSATDSPTLSTDKQTTTGQRPPGGVAGVCGALLAGLGLILPWMKVILPGAGIEESADGFDPELFGIPILVLTIVAVVAVLAATRRRRLGWLSILSGIGVLLLAAAGLLKADNTRQAIEDLSTPEVSGSLVLGTGMASTLVASLLLITAGIQAVRRR